MSGELIHIDRVFANKKETLGAFYVLGASGAALATGVTLELPWRNNQRNVSCIPAGVYSAEKRFTRKRGTHIHILDVPDRSLILMHKGNYYTDILGCILPGAYFYDINKDGIIDVADSGNTLKMILGLLPDRFKIEIVNKFPI